jgi:hypothetical protein
MSSRSDCSTSTELGNAPFRFSRHAGNLASEEDAVLERQLAMNVETWNRLRSHGVTEATKLKLDFSYDAPTRAAGEKLARLLRDETDYDVAGPDPSGDGFVVSGTTQQTTVSLDILNQWVEWMDAAGRQSDGCEFDGWGTQVPAKG